MQNKLTEMILRREPENLLQTDMAIKEVLQELILVALSETDFFRKAAFYGGTCLRIFYNLPRFSEDLDFSLLRPEPDFSWEPYFHHIEAQFSRYGLKVRTYQKEKVQATDTRSAFVKENTIETMSILLPENTLVDHINHNQMTTIKFEVDVNPPLGAEYASMNLSEPYPAWVRTFDLPSLFAGKISAVLLRKWGHRIKGRDFYDYLYYVGMGGKVNLKYLESTLKKANAIEGELTLESLRELLCDRFDAIDYAEAYQEAKSFVLKPSSEPEWNRKLFMDTLPRLWA